MYRVLRVSVLSGLASVVLSTHVFVAIDPVRVKVLQTPKVPTAGFVRISTDRFPQANRLRTPFALIARINNQSAGNSQFSIVVDGVPVCERAIAGAADRRVDCAVIGRWDSRIEHEVAIQGPSTAWTLDYLELATQHGHNMGANYAYILPADSNQYLRPALERVIVVWLTLTGILLVPAPLPLPATIRGLYKLLAGIVVVLLTITQSSQWVSDYRIVLSAGTFTRWLLVLFAPRLWYAWQATGWSGRREDIGTHRWIASLRAAFVALANVSYRLSILTDETIRPTRVFCAF
jgi:hypothetical protein